MTFFTRIFSAVNFSHISLFFLPLRLAFKSDPTLNTRVPRRKNFPVFLAEELLTFSTRSQRLFPRVSFAPRSTTNPGTSSHRAEKLLPPSWLGEKCPAVKKRSRPFDFWRAICWLSCSSWFGLTNQIFSTRYATGTKCNSDCKSIASCNQSVPREEYINQRWILQLPICERTRRKRRCKERRCSWERWAITTILLSRPATSITIIIITNISNTQNEAR